MKWERKEGGREDSMMDREEDRAWRTGKRRLLQLGRGCRYQRFVI